jgi:serine/threonine-protein kinase
MVHLFTLASRWAGATRYLDLAVKCAWHTWEDPERGVSLCCGLGGRAYALLNLYRHTGEAAWLGRARALADRAAREVLSRRAAPDLARSLYKGDAGLAVLAADLERPEVASMPMFEEEGWPRPGTA